MTEVISTEEYKRRMADNIKPKRKHPKASTSAGWRIIGGKRIFFRSKWEANYARYLEFLKQAGVYLSSWEYEPKKFIFEKIQSGTRVYVPDFRINLDIVTMGENGHWQQSKQHYWVEVKGWWDPKSKTKIKRFRKYYPNERLIIIDAKWFADNNKTCKALIKGWE